jgi:hypothetical protein
MITLAMNIEVSGFARQRRTISASMAAAMAPTTA